MNFWKFQGLGRRSRKVNLEFKCWESGKYRNSLCDITITCFKVQIHLANYQTRPQISYVFLFQRLSWMKLLRVTPDIREESERSACDLINFLNDSPTDLLVEPQTSTSKTCDSYQQGKPLQCHLCGKSYQYQGWLSRHLDQVHGTQAPTSTAPVAAPSNAEEAKSLQCHFCNKSYKYQGWLARHLQQIHGTQDSSSIPRSTTVEPPQAKPLKCHICGKGYQLQGWLDRHVDQVHSDQISIGAQASSNLSTPSTAGQAKPLQCHICGKDYQFQGWLDRHVDQVHSTQRSTSAPASPKLSTSSSVGQAKPLQCHICSKGYEYQGWLDRHMQQKHGTQSSPVYRSGASQSSARSTSINSTLEAKPLQCHLCGKGYVYQGWLNNHLRDVHGSSQSSRAVVSLSSVALSRWKCHVLLFFCANIIWKTFFKTKLFTYFCRRFEVWWALNVLYTMLETTNRCTVTFAAKDICTKDGWTDICKVNTEHWWMMLNDSEYHWLMTEMPWTQNIQWTQRVLSQMFYNNFILIFLLK